MMRRNATGAEAPSRGTRRRPYGLLVLNGALLALLGGVTFGPSADAQVRVRGSYTMAAGRVMGALGHVVYVADTANQELIALSYDPSTRQVVGIGHRNLREDSISSQRGGQGR